MKRSHLVATSRILLVLTLGVALSALSCDDDDSPTTPGETGLTVVSTTPPDDATGVPVDTDIVVEFSDPIEPSSFDGATVDVAGGTIPIAAGATAVDGNTATFDPDPPFERDAVYTVTLSTGITSTDGEELAEPVSWFFRTVTVGDTIPPRIVRVTPDAEAIDAPVDTAIVVRFDETIAPATVTATSLTLTGGSQAVFVGALDVNGDTARFFPDPDLDPSTTYTATVGTGITDLAGNALESPYTWSFTTEAAAGASALGSRRSGQPED